LSKSKDPFDLDNKDYDEESEFDGTELDDSEQKKSEKKKSKHHAKPDRTVKGKKDPQKIIKIIRNSIIGVLIFLIVFFTGVRLYFRLPVSDYYKASDKGYKIPGLSDGFIPQGLDYSETDNMFFITGYMKDGSSSPVYIVDKAKKKHIATVFLATEDGYPFSGHAGGLSVHGDYVYVADDYGLLVFLKADFMKAEKKGTTVRSIGAISTETANGDKVHVSCTGVDGDMLIVGEFFRDPEYPTLPSHKITTSSGDNNTALAIAYRFSDSKDAVFGLDPAPCAAYSLPEQVQGIAFKDSKMYLSTSWGVSKSNIYGYDLQKAESDTKYVFGGVKLPLYELDSDSMVFHGEIAPMSEEIIFIDGEMYTMCESASNKYIFGKFTSGKYCYKTRLGEMTNLAE